MDDATLDQALPRALGAQVQARRPLHGGDLSDVTRLDLADGRRVVLKTGPVAGVEARMLDALQAAGAPVPQVLWTTDTAFVMTFLPTAPATPTHWQALGHALRALHEHRPEDTPYGWPEDYAFGAVTIPAAPLSAGRDRTWPDFWAEARLAADLSALPPDIARRIEALCPRLPDLLPRDPGPGLLHGDLWQGNLHFGPDGAAHLIDPACCHGDGEVDLAMLHLVGQPGPGFDAAYGPLAPGWQARRPLYQLWPALVHLRLFGAGYRGLVERLLSATGA